MILVVTGSGDFLFKRLLHAVDSVAPLFDERFLLQTGQCSFAARHCDTVGVIAYGKLVEFYQQASIVVAHASSGPLIHTRRLEKPVLLVARNPQLGEIIDDHQIQLAQALNSEIEPMRCILDDLTELEGAIRNMLRIAQQKTTYRESSRSLAGLQQAIRTSAGFL